MVHSEAACQALNHIQIDEVVTLRGVNDCAGLCVCIDKLVLPRGCGVGAAERLPFGIPR